MKSRLASAGIRGILLDIEGTTTPIAFVHQVLFSYARERIRHYLSTHLASAEIVNDVAGLREEHASDIEQGQQPPPLITQSISAEIDSLTAYIDWLIDRDRKSPPLKSLQGRIWRDGYLDGTLRAQMFADVSPALIRWHRAGLTINIFSSGSALAQKLLFRHTETGDLTAFIANYFDTTIGPKTDTESYRRIASALDLPEGAVLFISDTLSELDAARTAGMQTMLCIRSGGEKQEPLKHHQPVRTLDDII